MTTSTAALLGYFVNLDERGEFYANVRDVDGETVYEVRSDEGGSISLIEDGFMSHKEDLSGLEEYLQDMGVISSAAELLPAARFEARLEEPESTASAFEM